MRFVSNLKLGILGLALLTGGCPPQLTTDSTDSTDTTQETDVELTSNRISAPDSTIVSNGKEFNNSATLTENSLVGIINQRGSFLYHPDLGDANLSDENSRRAVGFFIAQTDQNLNSSKENLRQLELGQQRVLSTGVGVKRIEDSVYEFTNLARRWVAVKNGQEQIYLSPLRQKTVPLPKSLVDILKKEQWGTSWTYSTREVTVGPDEIETYGAVMRAAPLVLSKGIADAAQSDGLLFSRVNAVDYLDFVCQGLGEIISPFIVEECLDKVELIHSLDTFEEKAIGIITGDASARENFKREMQKNLRDGISSCVISNTTGKTGEVAALFLDIATGLDWIVDQRVRGTLDVWTHSAYDAVEGIAPSADSNVYREVEPNDFLFQANHVPFLEDTLTITGSYKAIDDNDYFIIKSTEGNKISGRIKAWNDKGYSQENSIDLSGDGSSYSFRAYLLETGFFPDDQFPIYYEINLFK